MTVLGELHSLSPDARKKHLENVITELRKQNKQPVILAEGYPPAKKDKLRAIITYPAEKLVTTITGRALGLSLRGSTKREILDRIKAIEDVSKKHNVPVVFLDGYDYSNVYRALIKEYVSKGRIISTLQDLLNETVFRNPLTFFSLIRSVLYSRVAEEHIKKGKYPVAVVGGAHTFSSLDKNFKVRKFFMTEKELNDELYRRISSFSAATTPESEIQIIGSMIRELGRRSGFNMKEDEASKIVHMVQGITILFNHLAEPELRRLLTDNRERFLRELEQYGPMTRYVGRVLVKSFDEADPALLYREMEGFTRSNMGKRMLYRSLMSIMDVIERNTEISRISELLRSVV